ncbi:MAG: hypothetical protein MJZ20_04875 [Bacteroidaceae bacterium]|nr:hypothetical protein [Bacteroidaceae bacterium]
MKKYCISGFIVFSIAFTFLFVVAGFGNHMDPFYWMGLCEEYHTGFMTIGAIALGSAWIHVFGASVFTMRLLGWLLSIAALAIPYCCLLTKEQRTQNLHWLAICYCLLGYGVFQEYSPGTLSVFLCSVLATFWILYLRDRRWIYAVPLVVAMAIVTRFPNVVVLLFLSMILPIYGAIKHQESKLIIVDESILLLGSILFTGLLYFLLGVDMSLSGFTEGFSSQASGDHALSLMIMTLINKGMNILLWVAIILAMGFLYYRVGKFKSKWLCWGLSLVLAILLGLFLYYTFSWKDWYNMKLHYFLSSITIAIAIYVIIQSAKTKNPLGIFVAISFLCVGCVVPLGSDTAWLKLFPIYLCFIPIMVGLYMNHLSWIKYLYPSMVVLCGFVMITYCFNPIGSKSLFQGKVFGTQSLYHHIFIPKYADDYLNQLSADFDEYGAKDNTIVVGDGAHLFAQLTGAQTLHKYGFWSNIDDSAYVSMTEPCILENRPVVFCMHTPWFIYKDDHIGESLLENKLRDAGYTEIERKTQLYMIYLP